MKLERTPQPDVLTLLANGDVEGLLEAARFQDVKRDPDGRAADQGGEVRQRAILAFGELGAGDDPVEGGTARWTRSKPLPPVRACS